MPPRRLMLPLLVLLLLPLAACSAGSESTNDAAMDAGTAEREMAADAPAPEQGMDDDGEAAGEATGIAGGAGDVGQLPERPVTRTGERLIKEGSMTVEVAEGGFMGAYQRVIVAARDLGGFMVASNSASTGDGGTSGSVTVRVPVDRYEDLLTGVGRIGTVLRQEISSRDVTAEFTDLRSRLRHLRAQEVFYLDLLDEARSVQDAISVKQQLDGIQAQIEQAQGRLNLLEDRSSYSTLTVEIIEPGTTVVAHTGGRPLLADYWETARDGFVTVVGWLLVSAVSLAPLLLPLLLAFVLWRVLRRRAAAAAVAAEE